VRSTLRAPRADIPGAAVKLYRALLAAAAAIAAAIAVQAAVTSPAGAALEPDCAVCWGSADR
jgi:hypothetical protein